MILLGLSGKAGAGKDTVADRLVEQHGFEKRSFAGPLKHMLATLDPILDDMGTRLSHVTREFSKSQDAEMEAHLKRHFPEYRRLLQILGTDCIRAIDEDFWVKAAMRGIADVDENARVVFSDVRFPNEGQAIQDFRATGWTQAMTETWFIDRSTAGTVAHSSEDWAGNMDEDLIVDNDRDLRTLYRDVDAEAEAIIGVHDRRRPALGL